MGPVDNGDLQGEHHRVQPRPTCPFGMAKRPINHTKPRLSARRSPLEEFALQTVALDGRALRVRYHCGVLSQIVGGQNRQIDNY